MPQSPSEHEARRSPRETVDRLSRVWGASLAPTPALIVNISPHGCMLRCDQTVPMGEHLTVDIPAVGPLRGTVIWSLGARLGIEFEAPIMLETYLAMLDTLEAARDNG